MLRSINGSPISEALQVSQILVGVGSWKRAEFQVERSGVEFKTPLIIGDVPPDPARLYLYIVGVTYLAIGLFVYFRRGSAHKAQHFYIFCLTSFIFCTFHYTGKLNNFDKLIYWGNVVAGLLAPTVFLHFCLTFPEPRKWLRSRVGVAGLYVVAAAMIAVFVVSPPALCALRFRCWKRAGCWTASGSALLTAIYLLGAVALSFEYRKAEDPIVRQQLKWLRNGAFYGILPFALLYAAPYVVGFVPTAAMKLSVLTLQLVPLTLAYAVVRYRLMDVDILFRRGYAYTLATLAVLAAFYALVFTLGSLVQKNFKDLGNTGMIAVMLLAAFLFQPLRNWIQERLDRYFYRDQYDYRRTLVEFARELSSETDLDAMLRSLAERLMQTLAIQHLAFFLADDATGEAERFYLKMGVALKDRTGRPIRPGDPLDLSFLHGEPTGPICSLSGPVTVWMPSRIADRRRCAAPLKIWTSPITCRARCAAASSPIWA